MADPVPPTPTDPAAQIASMVNATTLMGDLFTKVNASIASLGGTIESLVGKFTSLGKVQSNITSELNNQSVSAAAVTQMILGVGNSFDGLNSKSKSVQSITEQFKQLQASGKFTGDALIKVAGAFEMEGVARKAGETISGFIERAAQGADQFAKLKNSYLETQGASGGLSAAWNKSGNSLAGLNEMVKQHSVYLNTIARATGNSTAEMANHWNALSSAIPGAADTQITALDGSGKSVSGLIATMRLASGTGQSFETITNNLTQAWSAYGLEGKDALAFTAQIYEANDKLGLKLSTTQKFVNDNAMAFKGITDNGNNAISVLNNMYDAFRKTGLSADESTGLITSMTKSVANLNLGQKAFLSAQSGGPGGLRGAIQIEQQLRSGDIEGVLKKAEASLKKQFGGKIVSQEEAGQSDVAAATFVKQREMLKSGAFGIKATDDNQATRILEAFKNGTSATVALKDKQSSLNDVMSRGEKLQSEGNTVMSAMARDIEGIHNIVNATMFDANQKYLGSTERTDRPEFAKQNAQLLKDGQTGAMTRVVDHASHENQSKNLISKDSKKSTLPEQKINDKIIVGKSESEMSSIFKNFIPNSLSKEKESKIKIANPFDIHVTSDKEKLFGNLSKRVSDQATGRGNQVGSAAVGSARTQAPAFAAQNQAIAAHTANQGQEINKHITEHKFDVTVRGLCIDCGRPVQPDAHSQARTDGASGTR